MKRIRRSIYLDKLRAFQDKQVIKVVTGVRRCGKSTLLEMMQDELREMGKEESQIVAVNLEDYENLELREPKALYEFIKQRMIKGQKTYVFLDEIQHVKDYADVVDALFIKPEIDLYITGSNAYLLSSEIATLLSGRYVEVKMLPLSFAEYAMALTDEVNLNKKYTDYISYSSFPYAIELHENINATLDYLRGIYSTVLLKDIMQRRKINDAMMLESVTRFVMDNIGNTMSTKKIADTMTSAGRKIDVKTVEKYLSALQESYIIYKAGRYNIKGKQLLKTQEKYYLVDVALRRVLLGTRATDIGHLLENVVFLELLRRDQEVYIGKVGDLEVDFMTNGPDGICYYQVAATVRETQTLERELAPLRSIADHHPKLLLTLDDDPEMDYDGIRRMNALNWLISPAMFSHTS